MLTDEQSGELGRVLRDAEHRVLERARRTVELSREGASEQGRDSIDLSNAEELVSTNMRLRDREQKLLAKIRDAIGRLEEQVIDECERCGGEIKFKRLLVRPVTTLCIECKEQAEEDERQQGGGPAEPSLGTWTEE